MAEYDDAGYGESAEYEDMGDELAVDAAVQAPGELKHISGDEVLGLQEKELVPMVYASISELAKKKTLSQWKVPEAQHKEFHKVTAISGRHNPAPEHLEGDLDQIFVTDMIVTEYVNGTSQPVNLHIANQCGNSLSSAGKSNFVLYPTGGVALVVNKKIHSPTDLMTRDMLEIWEACDPSVLPREFSKLDDNTPLMRVDGAGAKLLERKPKMFDNYRLDLGQMVPGTSWCRVDSEIGERLFNFMKGTIDGIKSNFTSVKDFVFTFEPMSGKWDDDSILVGDQAGLTSDKKVLHTERFKLQKNLISAKVQVHYGTIQNMFPQEVKK
jgi:hypothetical protein